MGGVRGNESDTDSAERTTDSDTDNTDTPDTAGTAGVLGDIDGDGQITANDALAILRASVGMAELTPKQKKLADADKDESITANDALAVLRYSVGMEAADSPINKPLSA